MSTIVLFVSKSKTNIFKVKRTTSQHVKKHRRASASFFLLHVITLTHRKTKKHKKTNKKTQPPCKGFSTFENEVGSQLLSTAERMLFKYNNFMQTKGSHYIIANKIFTSTSILMLLRIKKK